MPAAAITAAIIGAVTTAAATASSAIQAEVARPGDSVAGIFINKTRYSWDVTWYNPNHGDLANAGPSHHVMGYNEFKAKMAKSIGTNDDDAVESQLKHWAQSNLMEQNVSDWITKWDLKAVGNGIECLVRFHCEELGYNICCLTRLRPLGDHGAGVSLSPDSWFNKLDMNNEGTDLINHIKKIHTKQCQYSDGEGTKSANSKKFKVTFTPGGTVMFEVADSGWA